MKKFIVSALMALTCGVLFADTDMYLYWMISDKAGFTDQKGQAVSDNMNSYNARILVAGTADTYLDLYEYKGGQDGVKSYSAGGIQGWDMLARVTGCENQSFLVELFNSDGAAYRSAAVSYGALGAYISSMEGKSTPADTYSFESFRAVPEPTSGLLLLLGIAGLALKRKRA